MKTTHRLLALTLVLPLLPATLLACATKPKVAGPNEVIDGNASGTRTTATTPVSTEALETKPVAPATCTPPASVGFAFDSAQLDQAATDALAAFARCLAARAGDTVVVAGHADERGTAQYNVALGWRRARAVEGYLKQLGATPTFDVISYGKERPVVPHAATEAEHARNRRVEFSRPVAAPDHVASRE